MKKTILVLILIIPVLIALVTYLIAGFVGREIANIEIFDVWIPTESEQLVYNEFEKIGRVITRELPEDESGWDGASIWTIEELYVGDSIDLTKIIKILPAKAQFYNLAYKYEISTQIPEISENEVEDYIKNNYAVIDRKGIMAAKGATNSQITIRIQLDASDKIVFNINKISGVTP